MERKKQLETDLMAAIASKAQVEERILQIRNMLAGYQLAEQDAAAKAPETPPEE